MGLKATGLFLIKLCTVPVTAILWYLVYKSQRNEEEEANTELFLMGIDQGDTTTSAEGFKVITVKIPRRAVGAVIGKQGATIKKIQQATRTTVGFVDRSNGKGGAGSDEQGDEWTEADTEEDTNMETLKIRGLGNRVAEAERQILAIAAGVPEIEEGEMMIDQKLIGRIIGRSGENIRRMRSMYRVRIDIDRDPPPGSTGAVANLRRLKLTGTRDQIDACKSAIEVTIEETNELQNRAGSGTFRKKEVDSKESPSIAMSHHGSTASLKVQSTPTPQSTPQVKLTNGDSQPIVHVLAPPINGTGNLPVPPVVQLPRDSDRVEIMVSSVSDCSLFFAHLICVEAKQLEPLVSEITEYYSKQPPTKDTSHLLIGGLAAGYFPPDETWQRARIVSIQGDEVEVDYLDYGDCLQLRRDQVRPLDQPQFLTLPFQAMPLILHGVEPIDGTAWTPESVTRFEELTRAQQWHVLTVQMPVRSNPTQGTPEVILLDKNATPELDIAAQLVTEGHARWKN